MIINKKQKNGRGANQSAALNQSGFLPSIGNTRATNKMQDGDNSGRVRQYSKSANSWLGKNAEFRDRVISDAFEITQDKLDNESKIDAIFSGTTSVYCWMSRNYLVCANSGDSRAMLCSLVNGKWKATQLSRDHKPEEVDEAARIRRANGRIEQSRL